MNQLLPADDLRIKAMPDTIYQFMEKEKDFERGDNIAGWRVLEPDALLSEVVCYNGNVEFPKLVEVPEAFKGLYKNPFENMKIGDLGIRFVIKTKDTYPR